MNPFHHHSRGSMHPARVARIFTAHGGLCHVCKRKLRPGDDSNLAPCCSGCHTIKTGGDVSDAAKIKRVATKHMVPKRFKQGRGWR